MCYGGQCMECMAQKYLTLLTHCPEEEDLVEWVILIFRIKYILLTADTGAC